MTDTTKPFWGNDKHPDEDAQDFLKAMQHWGLNRNNATDMQKLENFRLNLKLGVVAEQWWDGLNFCNKDTWNHLINTFKQHWPSKTPTVKMVEEKQAALEQTRISKEDVGKWVKMNSVEELAHIVWVDNIEWLMATIPDTNGLLIRSVSKSMPRVLQKVTRSGHTTWAAFCSAVCTATLTQIAEAKEEKEAWDLREQVKKLQELCDTSTRDIMNVLQWLTVNTPSPTPHFPTSQTQPPNAPNYSLAPIFNAANQPPTHTAYQALNQPTHRHQTPAKHMNDVIQLTLPIHLNTPASQALYNAQIAQLNTLYAGQQVNKTQPYPLSPETIPVASEDHWKCGLLGHISNNCESPSQIPGLKGCWRAIALNLKCNCPPMVGNVNYVNEFSPWPTKEEYDHHIIKEFLASQGKGEGLSM
jgi:hypothetical protein